MLRPDRRDQEDRLHDERLAWVESTEGAVLALPADFPDGHKVPAHRHSRSQLLYALSGAVLVTTDEGRWMVPPEHAIWLPAGTRHAVEMLGEVAMRSIYVRPDALAALPGELKVVAMTALMRSLIVEAVRLAPNPDPSTRAGLLMGLLLHEVPALPPRPLGLPFPRDARLVELCRRFLAQPAPRAGIDGWARAAGMSRRSFTRLFHRQTGISLSTWRQQACLFAALPRLADGEPITRVALDLGYESVPAFTTMFKRMLGEPPRSYLRKVE